VGYDNTIGYLEGGFGSWVEAGMEVATTGDMSAADFLQLYQKNPGINLLDVRRSSEYASQHIVGAVNFPLDFINQNMSEVNRDKRYYLQCASGYRSMIAASILQARGFGEVINVQGGFKALSDLGIALTNFQEQQTEL
jgi:rhodanese-related sulfurtransferase